MISSAARRILIVDEDKGIRDELRGLLELDPDFHVVGEAASGANGVALADKLRPHLVLMDLHPSDMSGIHATRAIKKIDPTIIVVILSASDDISHFFDALKSGAQGYLIKTLHPASWHEYLRSILFADAPLSRELGHHILKEILDHKSPTNVTPHLTPNESELLHYLCRGYSNGEIADQLMMSENAVKSMLRDILHRFHLKNRIQLVRYAYEKGLCKPRTRPD